jgi:hypothetical protein
MASIGDRSERAAGQRVKVGDVRGTQVGEREAVGLIYLRRASFEYLQQE